jgi:hypothetical protein
MGAACFYEIQHNEAIWAKMNGLPIKYVDRQVVILKNAKCSTGVQFNLDNQPLN